MPLVRAYISANAMDNSRWGNIDTLIYQLHRACKEVVPAGINSREGPLTPGGIVFIPQIVPWYGMDVDVLLEIDAYAYKDRVKNRDTRARQIKDALYLLFGPPHEMTRNALRFAVMVKLTTFGWASDTQNPQFNGDMSMRAAIERAGKSMSPDLTR